jgi:hypothetical protein
MLGDIVSLIELLFDRHEKAKEKKKEIFDKFVEPTYLEFESVHQGYLESFQKYRSLIKTTDKPLNENHEVFELIQEDHIFTEGQRLKLLNLVDVVTKSLSVAHNNNSEAGFNSAYSFVSSIYAYLTDVDSEIEDLGWETNARRFTIFDALRNIAENESDLETQRSEMLASLNPLIQDLQERYAKVNASYLELRKSLIT